jgi:chromosome partitioning protein
MVSKSNPKINPALLASYGLVFNGDFFQLWRRVDGLILPLTPIQRFTDVTIPKLLKQLEYCLYSPPKALVTAIWNRKGGVAKTTNTINLGSVLALEGKKVLLIDMDTQNDLTMALKLDPANYSTDLNQCINELHAGRPAAAKTILNKTIQTRNFLTSDKKNFDLHILPGHDKSQKDFRDDINYASGTRRKLFQKLIHLLVEDYDYIFIDVSPASDDLTICTLFACDTLLIPSDYSRKTLHHAVALYHKDLPTIRTNREKQNALHLGPWNLGIVFSNCPSGVTPTSKLEKCIQDELKVKGFTGKQCDTRLAIYAQTKLAEFQYRPVICWHKSQITQLYKDLANEVFLNHKFIDD